jgi:hypothetical protein
MLKTVTTCALVILLLAGCASTGPELQVAGESAPPRCAENGSCFGDVSFETGKPKNFFVAGHYRADGTYVKSSYESVRQ